MSGHVALGTDLREQILGFIYRLKLLIARS
ncbi:hypothetical protein HNR19_000893 [Nocardioides thalensis]|uniref:Uncharacterized protein n=1 Tax=Nocardioides thalensis TaxID=1914755 RepID=A0A853BYD7_9ACTN|nr:hypothetical protein [Nocardioides thalensis]